MELAKIVEHVTLGDCAQVLAFIAGLIGSIAYLKSHIHEWVLSDTDKKLEQINSDACKDYIVGVLGDLERKEKLSPTEIQRFYDRYEQYTNAGGNGYIKAKVKELQDKGVLKTVS